MLVLSTATVNVEDENGLPPLLRALISSVALSQVPMEEGPTIPIIGEIPEAGLAIFAEREVLARTQSSQSEARSAVHFALIAADTAN